MAGFKPNMYRLMQLSQTTIPVAASFTHLFSQKRQTNRIEFVTDFPEGDEAEVVSSLQVHPQGWCALSRNISNDENSEWTCVHDIQEKDQLEFEIEDMSEDDELSAASVTDSISPFNLSAESTIPASAVSETDESAIGYIRTPSQEDPGDTEGRRHAQAASGSNSRVPAASQQEQERERELAFRHAHTASGSSSFFRGFPSRSGDIHPVTTTDVWEALVAIREVRSQRERERAEAERRHNGVEIALNHETETRMRIVRMSSGLPEVREAHEDRRGRRERRRRDAEDDGSVRDRSNDRESNNERERVQSENDSQYPSVTSIVIRYRRSPRRRDRPERSDPPEAAAREPQAGPADRPPRGTSRTLSEYEGTLGHMGGRTIVILGSGRNRMQQVVVRPMSATRINKVPKNHRIHQNVSRLTHYIQEPNVGKGFIKELCFSADGRLICSPFGYGVRLLAFSPQCSELSTCVPKGDAVKLYELGTNICHTDIVVSTKFSPRHCLLVSGCLTGRIVWHQPVV